MPPNDTEIIDLTNSSPQRHFVELDSDGEIIGDGPKTPAPNGKAGGRRRKKSRKRKPKVSEEGEVTQSSVDVSREQSPEKANGAGGRTRGGSGTSRDVSAKTPGAKSLLDRLSSPGASTSGARNRYERDEEGHREKDRRSKQKDRQSPPPGRDSRRRSCSPYRLPPLRDGRSTQDHKTRQNDASDRQRRAHTPDRSGRERPPDRDITTSLFFEDVMRAEVPAKMQHNDVQLADKSEQFAVALLLPAHVQVLDGDGVDPVPFVSAAESGSEDEGYIEYLDYDDDRRAGIVRYFETVEDDDKLAKPKTIVCKNCGAEGDHRTYECPVVICLTCGARDEHSTRSCPISKTCFSCGMKGHINKTCPNRYYGRAGPSQYDDCDRCGSQAHSTNECPTLWRLYDYVGDAERTQILEIREEKRTLALGQGGEGYIATDEWCYNCGDCGHLGDDCGEVSHVPDRPREPSAFSVYNTLAGPFADPDARPPTVNTQRAPRDWELAGAFADGYGGRVPVDVGKQGRRKERARMEQRAREWEDQQDDPDDWFGSRAKGKGGNVSRDSRNGSRGGKKMNINFSDASRRDDGLRAGGRERDRRPYDGYLPGPSRETDSIHIRGAARLEERVGTGRYSDLRSKERDRRDTRRRDDRGPRYKGGYNRS